MGASFPRPLTEQARVLAFMLSADDPRMVQLRRQAAMARVSGMCPCGCATVHFKIDRASAEVATGLGYAAVYSYTKEHTDVERLRELIVFVDAGWLSSLEVVYGDTVPRLVPDPTGMEPPFVPRQPPP